MKAVIPPVSFGERGRVVSVCDSRLEAHQRHSWGPAFDGGQPLTVLFRHLLLLLLLLLLTFSPGGSTSSVNDLAQYARETDKNRRGCGS